MVFTATRPTMTRAATQVAPRRTASHSPTAWRGLLACAFPVRVVGVCSGWFSPVVSLSWWASEGGPSVEGVLGGRIDVGVLCPERGGRIDELLPGGWMLRLPKGRSLMGEACPGVVGRAGF